MEFTHKFKDPHHPSLTLLIKLVARGLQWHKGHIKFCDQQSSGSIFSPFQEGKYIAEIFYAYFNVFFAWLMSPIKAHFTIYTTRAPYRKKHTDK
jgi:hypothetical protein